MIGSLSDPLLAAVIGASAALIVVFINTFAIENYRRFQSRKALAGALAGELSSYSDAFELLEKNIRILIEKAKTVGLIEFNAFDKPSDKVFESCVKDIGLLGSRLAEDVAYVYNNLNAFRIAFDSASKSDDVNYQELSLRYALGSLERIKNKDLPTRLHEEASKSYLPYMFNINANTILFVVLIIVAFFLGVA